MTSSAFSTRTVPPVTNDLSSPANYDGVRRQGMSQLEFIEADGEKGSETSFPDPEDTATKDDYPSGLSLVLVTGAVALSVFLTSLDQVSHPQTWTESLCAASVDQRRQSWGRPSPRSLTNSAA